MIDQTPLEQKRAEARAYRGVTYDDRINKFTASIMIRGERRYLGAFNTAGEASVIYDQTRAENRIHRAPRGLSGASAKTAMIAFEETAVRDAKGLIAAGQIMTAQDGQRFRLEGVRVKEKHKEYIWSSCCKICGALFGQSTGVKLRNANGGMTRTCVEHRGMLNKLPIKDWPDPVEWDAAPVISIPTVAAKPRGVEQIPASWGEDRKAFAQQFREAIPNATLAQIEKAHVDHLKALANSGLTSEEQRKYDAMLAEQQGVTATSAREEDVEILASDQPADNSDLA